ncbi:MAG: FHA domain-containing protein [Miniphocaeibacter sp.]|uniref:FHA domain-containing protein n=1 Tax=Miniphocaeibacter sp. TaxID=3100973 RepID=UPI0017A5DB0C|nr:FHA domain-containing protein [Gallicola sp.]
MKFIIDLLDKFLSVKLTANLTLYELLSMLFKYVFVIIIYYFILNIIKMIYLDIKGISNMNAVANTYLKLINRKEKLPFKIQEHYFIGDNTVIGRSDQNDIVLKDRFISKKHARITKRNGVYFIEDLNSANGVFINGQKVENIIELKDKDLIDIGQVEFLFVNGEDEDEN